VYGEVGLIWKERRLAYGLTVCRAAFLLPLVWSARHPGFYQQGTLVRRSVFDGMGGFSPQFALTADGHFWQKASAHKFRFAYVGATTGLFRIRAGQLSQARTQMRKEARNHRAELPGHANWLQRLAGSLIWRCYGMAYVSRRLRAGGRLRMASMVGTDPTGDV